MTNPATTTTPKPHFVLIPLMAQGHTIPMIDLAHLLAQRDVQVTFITTPFNASRIRTTINRARDSGLPIKFVELPFPCEKIGLPEGCENLDVLSSVELTVNFFNGLKFLAEPLEMYLRQLPLRPSCMIADLCHPWTNDVAQNLSIPRLTFFSICCFTLLCMRNIVYDTISDEHEPFVVPGLTQKIMITKAQAPEWFAVPGLEEYKQAVNDVELAADGVVVNTFDDLEPAYIDSYQKAMGKKVWAVGPFSLYNKELGDMVARGANTSIDTDRCMRWLDAREPRSVVYVSFGSLTFVDASQLIEVGLGLLASGYPFVWVIKNSETSPEVEKWLIEFEERISSRGFIVKGWAPQVMILSHHAVGGFMTHCGWNSTLEGVTAGMPMITWPHFGDQFLNERMVVDVLRIGVSVGVLKPTIFVRDGNNIGDEHNLLVKKDDVEKVIKELMDEGEVAEERRKRATEFGKKARKAMSKEGSSHVNMTSLIENFKGVRK